MIRRDELRKKYTEKGNAVVLRKKHQGDAGMDITPMIDINFLLLIFFLVCSTTDRPGSVSLPTAYFGTAVSERDATVITLDGSGFDCVAYLGSGTSGTPLSLDREKQELEIIEAVKRGFHDGKHVVVIRAGGDLFQSEIHRVETAIAAVEGVRTIHLAVREVR